MSVMSDTELRRRRKFQAGLSTTTATIGLTSLGAKGAGGVLRRVASTQKKAGNIARAKQLKGTAKRIDAKFIPTALTAGAGLGGVGGFNYAAITRDEAKRKVSKAKVPTGPAGYIRRGMKDPTKTAADKWAATGRRDNPWRKTDTVYPNQGYTQKGALKKIPVAITASNAVGWGGVGAIAAYRRKKKMQTVGSTGTVNKAFDPEQKRKQRLHRYEDATRKVGTAASLTAAGAGAALGGRDLAVGRAEGKLNKIRYEVKPTAVNGKPVRHIIKPEYEGAAREKIKGQLKAVRRFPGLTKGRGKLVGATAGVGLASTVASDRIANYRRKKGGSYDARYRSPR